MTWIGIVDPFRGTPRGKEGEPKQTVLDSKVNVTGILGNDFGQLIQKLPKHLTSTYHDKNESLGINAEGLVLTLVPGLTDQQSLFLKFCIFFLS